MPLELRAQLIFLYRNQHVTFLLNHYFDPNNDDYDDQQEIGWRTTRGVDADDHNHHDPDDHDHDEHDDDDHDADHDHENDQEKVVIILAGVPAPGWRCR